MYDRVTVAAKQLKVIRIKCDCRIIYVVWCQVYLVVNDDACLVDPASEATLAQSALASGIVAPASLPRF